LLLRGRDLDDRPDRLEDAKKKRRDANHRKHQNDNDRHKRFHFSSFPKTESSVNIIPLLYFLFFQNNRGIKRVPSIFLSVNA
jgi:hypothetical protein